MAEYENPYQDKINTDKKNLIRLKAGTANQQLINAAYLGARQEPPAAMTWLNAAQSGFASFTEAVEKTKKARQAELDEMNGKIDANIDALETNGYSLGENYYTQANMYTQKLRERFLAEEGNPAEQNKIKMELNVASQNIANVKGTIEELATAWKGDDIEKSGLNPTEQRIMDIAMDSKGTHATWIEGENTFGWRDPKSGDVYTVKQVQDIQKMVSKDHVAKEEVITDENKQADLGNDFRVTGEGAPFNSTNQMYHNEKRITKENIRFFINGDFTGDGTPSFKDELPNHPDFKWDAEKNPIFDALASVMLPSGEPMYPDKDNNGLDINDLATAADMEDGVFSDDEKIAAMQKVYDAITTPDADGYNFDVTKKLIAEYMTLRQQERFYGKPVSEIEDINPEKYDNLQEYLADGGNLGYAKQVMGYTWIDPIYKSDGVRIKKKGYWKIDPSKGYKTKFSGKVL